MTQYFWTPDFCPPGESCQVEITEDWNLVRFVKACPHHQSIGNEQRAFAALLQSSRLKETARWEAHKALGLPRQHPGLRFTVDPAGDITVHTEADETTKTTVRTVVEDVLSREERLAGTSRVMVG